MDLKELRNGIDRIDAEILSLFMQTSVKYA